MAKRVAIIGAGIFQLFLHLEHRLLKVRNADVPSAYLDRNWRSRRHQGMLGRRTGTCMLRELFVLAFLRLPVSQRLANLHVETVCREISRDVCRPLRPPAARALQSPGPAPEAGPRDEAVDGALCSRRGGREDAARGGHGRDVRLGVCVHGSLPRSLRAPVRRGGAVQREGDACDRVLRVS
ncbi:hypothetical protein BC936DRAFT_140131 [Jimgerdemannia flammicorona]|uniref:Uncharacterized protein n=1 Tax=Jimgerdemannia flammicorona TaxID=994334 RepID=A0A433DH29_9FUNG|nr:hypothetical protein BC936DRAFT_140131 [Jimgerdemannia flammicorona]